MAKFRRKPVVVQADQWFPGRKLDGVKERRRKGSPLGIVGVIQTPRGDMVAMPGDWIITGVTGEKYPCREDIFYKTYEPAPAGGGFSQPRPSERSSHAVTDRRRNRRGR